MFSVKCLGSVSPTMRSLDRGNCFGFSDQPIVFEISSSYIATPLTIRFIYKEDQTFDPVSFVVGEIINDVVDVMFYNVKDGSTGGLRTPVEIVRMKGFQLSMYFRMDRAFGIPTYSLLYEFFETVIPEGQR